MWKLFENYKDKKWSEIEKGKHRVQFLHVMDFARFTVKYEETVEEQIAILDYLMEVIKTDFQAELRADMLYKQEARTVTEIFPVDYAIAHHMIPERGPKENWVLKTVDLSKDCVLLVPWSEARMIRSIKNLFKNDFCYYSYNHWSYYYTYVDLCYVYSGNHSIAAGIHFRKGSIQAEQIDITPLFPHVHTDGIDWYNSHTGEVIGQTADFRIGALYEIAKLKKEIETKQEP